MGATINVMVEILFIYWLYDRVGGRFSVGFLASRELVGALDGKPIELSQSAHLPVSAEMHFNRKASICPYHCHTSQSSGSGRRKATKFNVPTKSAKTKSYQL
jgi:hypothetical protein